MANRRTDDDVHPRGSREGAVARVSRGRGSGGDRHRLLLTGGTPERGRPASLVLRGLLCSTQLPHTVPREAPSGGRGVSAGIS